MIKIVRERNPLVLHYTNISTIVYCNLVCLAVGGSPLMSYCEQEIGDMAAIASSVVINIGTMNSAHLNLFINAGLIANEKGVPIIFDPVGVFASGARREFAGNFLSEIRCAVIKGNGAELSYLAGVEASGKGVDSADSSDLSEVVRTVALKYGAIAVATGGVDYISDGARVAKVYNGSKHLRMVTGTGCMVSSLVGAFVGANGVTMESVVQGVLTMSMAGEMAASDFCGSATLRTNIIDRISMLTEVDYATRARVEWF